MKKRAPKMMLFLEVLPVTGGKEPCSGQYKYLYIMHMFCYFLIAEIAAIKEQEQENEDEEQDFAVIAEEALFI